MRSPFFVDRETAGGQSLLLQKFIQTLNHSFRGCGALLVRSRDDCFRAARLIQDLGCSCNRLRFRNPAVLVVVSQLKKFSNWVHGRTFCQRFDSLLYKFSGQLRYRPQRNFVFDKPGSVGGDLSAQVLGIVGQFGFGHTFCLK